MPTAYSVHFLCNECSGLHPMRLVLALEDGPPHRRDVRWQSTTGCSGEPRCQFGDLPQNRKPHITKGQRQGVLGSNNLARGSWNDEGQSCFGKQTEGSHRHGSLHAGGNRGGQRANATTGHRHVQRLSAMGLEKRARSHKIGSGLTIRGKESLALRFTAAAPSFVPSPATFSLTAS